jgi:ribonuclease HII
MSSEMSSSDEMLAGARRALRGRMKRRAKTRRRLPQANLSVEHSLMAQGHRLVAGIDEVGRGAWAGPLVVGVVVVDASTPPPPKGTTDSKLLTANARQSLVGSLEPWCVSWSLGEVSAQEIDLHGLSASLTIGARRALELLPQAPDALILDGTFDFVTPRETDATFFGSTGESGCPVLTLARADRVAASVAAASILAKVMRDATMCMLAGRLPGFGFERHKGYGTPEHATAIESLGITSEHRRSWSFALDVRDEPARVGPRGAPR